MESKEIFVSVVKSNKSDNNVWAVAVTGDEQPSAHCKSPYKAMRFMFLLKQRTGIAISAESLTRLSQEIARQKAQQASAAEGVGAEVPQDAVPASSDTAPVEKPKRTRKPREKKSAESAAVPD